MATHGNGTLSSLIKSRSSSSLQNLHRRLSSFRSDDDDGGRRALQDEEADDYKRSDERRLSLVLNGPQVRSQRLIGNSNPRYRWERYWKTEEQLKPLRKPMYAPLDLLKHSIWSCTEANIWLSDVSTTSEPTH